MSIIERLEAATGPDRKLDAEIARSLGWTQRQIGQVFAWFPPDQSDRMKAAPPKWTASIDAARTLLPEGWFTSDYHQGPSGGNWWSISRIRDGEKLYTSVTGAHTTPEIALLLAILKARGHE